MYQRRYEDGREDDRGIDGEESRADNRGDDRGNRTSYDERGTRGGINEGDTIKVKRIISMNDELFYMSSTSDGWE